MYLTGGAALHRHYFRDRYSDGLDLFLNRHEAFSAQVEQALDVLAERGFEFDQAAAIRAPHFSRAVVRTAPADLKLDFVNDSAPRFGKLVSGKLFPRIDALDNILSNKLTALFRLEAKDFADVWTIANAVRFHWRDVAAEASQKLLASSTPELAELIRSFPSNRFDAVRWRRRPDRERFLSDVQQMSQDLVEVGPNSLAGPDATPLPD